MNPESYEIQLEIDFETGSFRGTVLVRGSPADPTERWHAVGLGIDEVRADGQLVRFELDPAHESLVLQGVPPRAQVLSFRFHGAAQEKALTGLYWTRYGTQRALTTQFAPVSARRLFPCRDEPAAKARFRLEVAVDPGLEVVFNTPPESVTSRSGRKVIRFQETPRMSPYLLYLGVGRFEPLEGRAGDVRLRVLTPPGRSASGAWALEIAQKVLPLYARYYGIGYPLPKLDLLAIPDLWAGAMENWGAISFREAELLADRTTPTRTRMEITDTIAHEIAHQWFGNLVTMEWWDDIWLNESFATFVSHVAVAELFPEWEMWDKFARDWTGWGLEGDSYACTHAIEVPVKDPEEIAQIFDEISYGKGASVLRMIETFLGPETFRTGVSRYLAAHAYGNAKGHELWTSLSEASGQPVDRIMETWIRVPGHPVVSASVEGHLVRLRQGRFRYQGTSPDAPWPIPLRFQDGEGIRTLLLETPEAEIRLDRPERFWLDPDGSGFYRAQYDAATCERLRRDYPSLPPSVRRNVLRDLGAFLLSGDATLPQYLAFVEEALKTPTSTVSHVISDTLSRLHGWVPESRVLAEAHRRFHIAEGDRLGLGHAPGEPPVVGALRESILLRRVRVDDAFAVEVAAEVRGDGASHADPDVRSVAWAAYARTRGGPAVPELLERIAHPPTDLDAYHAAAALGYLPTSGELADALEGITRGTIPSALAPLLLRSVIHNPAGKDASWSWLVQNLDALARLYTGSGFMSRILEESLPVLGRGRLEEVRRTFEGRAIPEGSRGLRKGLEMLRILETRAAYLSGPP